MSVEISNERRESYRCLVSEHEPPGILRTRKKDLLVRLHEESAGGFCVISEKKANVKEGETLSLGTGSSCCEVKVVHITQCDGETRIGLQRIRELNSRDNLLSRNTFVKAGIVAVLCLTFFIYGSSQSSEASTWTKLTKLFGVHEKVVVPAEVNEADQLENHEEELAVNFLRLDQLMLPEFSKELELTSTQQKQVFNVIKQTTTALSILYDRREELTPEDWSELGVKLLHTTSDEIQEVLSDEQRARWKALSEEEAATTTVDPSASAG